VNVQINIHRKVRKEKDMPYAAKDYSKLLGISGFSETLLKNHFTLYQGYVTNTNKVNETLEQMLKDGKDRDSGICGTEEEVRVEFNGMRLHEYYFENLGGKTALDNTDLLASRCSAISAVMRYGKRTSRLLGR